MAATVYLSESNGAGPVVTDDVDNCNFGGADTPNLVPATNPIVRPNSAAVEGYSFQKQWRIKVQDMGGSALIQTLKFWKSSGALLLAEKLFWDNDQAYTQPTDNKNTGAYNQDVPTSETFDPNISIGGNPFGTIAAAPAYSDYMVFQVVVNYSNQGLTPIGALNQKTFIFQYDES